MIVGVTACSAELSNNGTFKPIDVELLVASTTSNRIRTRASANAHGRERSSARR